MSSTAFDYDTASRANPADEYLAGHDTTVDGAAEQEAEGCGNCRLGHTCPHCKEQLE